MQRSALLHRSLGLVLAIAFLILPARLRADTLFSDDFGPKPLDAWTPSPLGLANHWDGSGGAAAWDGGGHTQLWTGSAQWTDYRVAASFVLQNGNNYPGGLRGRVDPATGAGYAAWLYPADGVVKLFRAAAWNIDTPGLALLAQASVGTIAAGVASTLSLEFSGSQIAVALNGTTVIQATDAALASGAVALDVSNQPIAWDDVLVAAGSATLFSDDFSPRPLRDWTPSPLGLAGNWDASTGVAVYNGGGHTQLWAGSAQWADYRVETRFRLANGSNYPGGLRGRVDPATGAGYAAWLYPGDGVVKLWRSVAWNIDTAGLTLLREVSVGTITPGVFHTLALVFEGSQVAVELDGTQVAQVSDATLAAGAVALDVSNQPIDFDDVAVTTLAPPSQLLADDFSAGLGGWTPSPLGLFRNWSSAAGTAAYNGGGHTQIYAGDPAWTDYALAAKVRLANGSNFPGGIRGRVNTASGESYAAWLYPADGVVKLFRAAAWNIDTPGLALLAQAAVGTIAPGVFHDLVLRFEGSSITVSFDGATVIDATDAVLTSGAVALDVSNQPIEFDDVVVTGIGTGGPPPDTDTDPGPGGPILVISKAGSPFTRYAGEILLAEGFNEYAIREIATVTPSVLAGYDVAILGEMALSADQVAMLTDWVNGGGNLLALRPDAQLAGLLGITPAGTTVANGYLAVDTAAPPGAGITGATLQFHGTADRYTLSGAAAVASLYSDAVTPTAPASPAATLRGVGPAGGHAAAFTFDLARSIVLTRQGNPAWAGQERDGVSPIRSDDLFFGGAASDPQPDWVDLSKVAIPQADEQQRLLGNLILTMARDRKPLPRFWYFPRGAKAVVLMTGDDHGNNGTEGRVEAYEAASAPGCSVADWECVRGTSYIYPSTPLAAAAAEAFETAGFEIAVHVSSNCADWTPSSLATFYTAQLADFASLFPTLDAPATNRTHCIAWSDWATQPKVEKAHGIRLDTNYYDWPPAWVQDRPGFFTGSGMPMRFADLDGTQIDVYQAVTQMTDESGQTYPFTIDSLLDKALGSEGFYGVFTANMHTDTASHAGSDAIVASAQARSVPIVTARQMLTWLDGRNGSSFGALAWSGNTLTFTVTAAAGANGLRAMLPMAASAGTLSSLSLGGSPVSFTSETVKGISYAVFPAVTGSYAAAYTP